MIKQLSTTLLLLLFCACHTAEETKPDSQLEVSELINIQIEASNISTKVLYEPNKEISTYAFSWELGDGVSLTIPNTDNENQRFIATSAASSTLLNGEVVTWSGEQTIYAIYPYSTSGYIVDPTTQTFLYDITTQVINATSDNSYENSLMVVTVDGATASSEEDYHIPDLYFTQVMSLFKLEIIDIPDGERCTTVGFEAASSSFVASADVNLASGGVAPRTYSSSVSAIVENHGGSEASLNFALLPVDLSGLSLTLFLTTENDTETKVYTYQIEKGINFESNNLLYYNNDALSLTGDFTELGADRFYLADFDDGDIPDGDTWIIYDTEATTTSFAGLRDALDSVYAADNNRRISIEFPHLEAIPQKALSYGTSSKLALSAISAPQALSVGQNAFSNCRSLTTVELPLITSIETCAFECCTSLKSVELPLATSIEEYAFTYCTSLLSVELPQATSIKEGGFDSCTSLTSVELPLAISIGEYAFGYCSSLISVEFPSTTSIGAYAFYGCTSITSVDLPMATSIEKYTFFSCYTLTSVEFPLVSSIEEYAFSGCTSLTSVELPSVTTIGNNAFSGCSSLIDVELPLVSTIKNSAFSSCTSLKVVELPLTTSISTSAFSSCTSLSSVELPSVTSIGSYVFFQCETLSTISLATNEGVQLYSFGTGIFSGSNLNSSYASNITLTLGVSNIDHVVDNTLTISGNSYTFNNIIITNI